MSSSQNKRYPLAFVPGPSSPRGKEVIRGGLDPQAQKRLDPLARKAMEEPKKEGIL